jgi:hypothetical protein
MSRRAGGPVEANRQYLQDRVIFSASSYSRRFGFSQAAGFALAKSGALSIANVGRQRWVHRRRAGSIRRRGSRSHCSKSSGTPWTLLIHTARRVVVLSRPCSSALLEEQWHRAVLAHPHCSQSSGTWARLVVPSANRNPQSRMPNRQSAIVNPQSSIHNRVVLALRPGKCGETCSWSWVNGRRSQAGGWSRPCAAGDRAGRW